MFKVTIDLKSKERLEYEKVQAITSNADSIRMYVEGHGLSDGVKWNDIENWKIEMQPNEVCGLGDNEAEARYRVVADLQGGEFGMGRDYTVEQWRNQAMEWADMDEDDGLAETLADLPRDEVLDFISNMWALKFRKVRKDKRRFEGGCL